MISMIRVHGFWFISVNKEIVYKIKDTPSGRDSASLKYWNLTNKENKYGYSGC